MKAELVERAENLLRAAFDLAQPLPMLSRTIGSDQLSLQPAADGAA